MAIKVLIRRKFKEIDQKTITERLIKARTNAMGSKGYISTETLVSCDEPRTYLMVSMWQNKEAWDIYKNSATRQESEREFEKILDGKTKYEVFNLGM